MTGTIRPSNDMVRQQERCSGNIIFQPRYAYCSFTTKINAMKMKIVTIISFVLTVSVQLTGQTSVVQENYRAHWSETDSLEKKICEMISGARETSLSDYYLFDDLITTGLLPWIEKTRAALAGYETDSVELYLPPLGVDTEEAFTGDGYLAVYYTNGEKSELESVNLPPLHIVPGEKTVIERAAGKEITFDSAYKIIKAEFNVFPEDVRNTEVSGQYLIENSSVEAVTEIGLILRHALDFSSLKVDKKNVVTDVDFYEYQGFPLAVMNLKLPTPLQPGEQTVLSFSYKVAFHHHRLGRKPVGFTENRGFVLQEISWFPKQHPGMSESFPYSIEIKVPEGFMATSSGILVNRRKESGYEYFSYNETSAQSPYFIWGEYIEDNVKAGDTEVLIWTPADRSVSPQYMKDRLKQIIQSYQEMLPVPHFEAPQKFIAVTRYGGYGPVGNILLNDSYFTKEAAGDPESMVLIAHELAHAWTNSLSQPAGDLSLFLSEGFAVYLSNTNLEAFMPEEEVKGLWVNSLMNYEKIAYREVPPVKLNEEVMIGDNQMFRGVVYDKSALLLRSCESALGKENLLRRYSKMLQATSSDGYTYTDLKHYLTRGRQNNLAQYMDMVIQEGIVPDYLFERENGQLYIVRQGPGMQPASPEIRVYDGGEQLIECREVDLSTKSKIQLNMAAQGSRIVIDPDHRLLQSDIDNDIYPDNYFSVEEEKQVNEMIIKLFSSIASEDTQYAASALAEEEGNIPVRQRQSILVFLSKGKIFDLVDIQKMSIIRYTDTKGLVKLFFSLRNGKGEVHTTRANITIVKEQGQWKYTNLGIVVVGFTL